MKNLNYLFLTSLLTIFTYPCLYGQHEYSFDQLISSATRERANQKGEAFQDIEVTGDNSFLKGTLRVLKANDSDNLNFVQIGKWIYHGKFPTLTGLGKMKSRDTTEYDSAGNILWMVYYTNKNEHFQLETSMTADLKEGQFIQNEEHFKSGVKVRRLTYRIVDFTALKDRHEKIMIPIMHTHYKNGRVKSIQTFDAEGQLIMDKEYLNSFK